METIWDLIEYTIEKTKTEGSDVDKDFLLKYLNEKRDEIVEEIKAFRGEDHFSKDVYHDLFMWQYKYTGLLAALWGNIWSNTDPINRVSTVEIKYSETWDYRKASIKWLHNLNASEEFLAKNQTQNSPIVCLAWKHLYVFPTLQEWTVKDGIRLYWLIILPPLTLETSLKDVWGRRIHWEYKILIDALSPILYEHADNFVFYQSAAQAYEIKKKKLLRRIWKLKEPMERSLPNEQIAFYSN